MICETVILGIALAGLPVGSCALKCDLSGGIGIEVTGDGCQGRLQVDKPMAYGESIPVQRVGASWLALVKQLNEQCLMGGFVQWPRLEAKP